METSEPRSAPDYRLRLDEAGKWQFIDADGNIFDDATLLTFKARPIQWPSGNFRLEQISRPFQLRANAILDKHGLSIGGCGNMTIAELLELANSSKRPAGKNTPTDASKTTKDSGSQRGSKKRADELIAVVLTSKDSCLIGQWVFADKQELGKLCSCSPNTAMKTKFWIEDRASEQAKWNRTNGGRKPKPL